MKNFYIKSKFNSLFFFILCSVQIHLSAQTEFLQNILIASDAIRNPQISFESKVEILEYKNKALIQHMVLEGKSQFVSDGKYFRTIMKTIFPKKKIMEKFYFAIPMSFGFMIQIVKMQFVSRHSND